MKVTTKTGDHGTTFLIKERPKDDLRVEVLGAVDTLQAELLMTRFEIPAFRKDLDIILNHIDQLFTYLALDGYNYPYASITWLETQNALREKYYVDLQTFVRASTKEAVLFNKLRTQARHVERLFTALARVEEVSPDVCAYCNRLSDYFFIIMLQYNQ